MALTLRTLIALLACACLPPLARAQPSSAPAAPRVVDLRFTVFALGGLDTLHYVPRSGQAPEPLRFYSAYRSATYRYLGPPRIRFFNTASPAADTPPIATYDVPENARDLLLVFFPRTRPPETAPHFQIVGIEDGPDQLPAGSFKIINFSERDYVAQFGSQRLALPRGVGPAYTARGRVALLFATRFGSNWMPSGRHDFTITSRDRVTVLLFPPSAPGSVYPIVRHLVDAAPGSATEFAQSSEEE